MRGAGADLAKLAVRAIMRHPSIEMLRGKMIPGTRKSQAINFRPGSVSPMRAHAGVVEV
jgi:hypothetical protein